eukprot:TRINITY_DN32677_c0_g1_i2.p1 TRINITY_DN32677_c0_g1~~TRINITY_DN32677_c0_g1_i2.p1  ORF type:complete len:1494 (+),score=281.93 TRINITY_DN32677_c0_g1_i2:79-4560(+)
MAIPWLQPGEDGDPGTGDGTTADGTTADAATADAATADGTTADGTTADATTASATAASSATASPAPARSVTAAAASAFCCTSASHCPGGTLGATEFVEVGARPILADDEAEIIILSEDFEQEADKHGSKASGGDARDGSSLAAGAFDGSEHLALALEADGLKKQKAAEDAEKGAKDPAMIEPRQPWNRCLPCVEVCYRIPGCVSLLFFAAASAFIVFTFSVKPVQIEASFDSFLKTDTPASMKLDIYMAARKHMRTTSGRRLEEEKMSRDIYQLTLVYQFRDKPPVDGLMNRAVLRKINAFETDLRGLPFWKHLCEDLVHIDEQPQCNPGYTFTQVGLATLEHNEDSVVPASVALDGKGWAPLSLPLVAIMAKSIGLEEVFFPESYEASAAQIPEAGPRSLRSVFYFNVNTTAEGHSALKVKWQHFAVETLFPFLAERFGDEQQEPRLDVFYDGTTFSDIEVLEALQGDVALASLSLLFVLVYLSVHTCSPLLSIVGMALSLVSVPFAYAICAWAGMNTVSFASFIAIFLIIGFGCDTILVYADYWQASKQRCKNDRERLAWTYYHGGEAAFATAFATSLSFFANMLSVIHALRWFGFFMGLCVISSWVLISLIYVPLCLLDERCCCHRGHGQRSSTARGEAFAKLSKGLFRSRCTCTCIALLLMVVGIVVTLSSLSLDYHSPEILPEDHPRSQWPLARNKFKSLEDSFQGPATGMPEKVDLCSLGQNFLEMERSKCPVMWCDGSSEPSAPDEETPAATASQTITCPCQRLLKPPCQDTEQPMASVQLLGPSVINNEIFNVVLSYLARTEHPAYRVTPMVGSVRKAAAGKLPPLLIHHWLEGTAHVDQSMTAVEVGLTQSPLGCGWTDVCHCDVEEGPTCKVDAEQWTPVPQPLTIPYSSLTEPGIPHSRRLFEYGGVVRLLWGLRFDLDQPLLGEFEPETRWSFDPSFTIEDPWVQRAIYNFCTDVPPEMAVVYTFCWLRDFRSCVEEDLGSFFPVLRGEFQRMARLCDAEASGYTWTVDEKVVAIRLSMYISGEKQPSHEVALQVKQRWDKHVADWLPTAPGGARGMVHVSSYWAKAAEQAAVVYSVQLTMLSFLGLAFLVVVLFTRSLAMALVVCIATISVQVGLLFFIVIIMDWELGMLEGICLIYFIGYAVTYSLHVGHMYAADVRREGVVKVWAVGAECEIDFEGSLPEDMQNLDDRKALRFLRVRHALTSIGGATLGSALTTIGASVFLLFSKLTIFVRLGVMCLVVTMVSVFVSLIPLPACLCICGPVWPGQCKRLKEEITEGFEDPYGEEWDEGEEEEPEAEAPPADEDLVSLGTSLGFVDEVEYETAGSPSTPPRLWLETSVNLAEPTLEFPARASRSPSFPSSSKSKAPVLSWSAENPAIPVFGGPPATAAGASTGPAVASAPAAPLPPGFASKPAAAASMASPSARSSDVAAAARSNGVAACSSAVPAASKTSKAGGAPKKARPPLPPSSTRSSGGNQRLQ